MKGDAVLVLNAGSSTLKYALHGEGGECLHHGNLEGADASRNIEQALAEIEDHLGGRRLVAAGHRVVHGGDRYSQPVAIDAAVLATLETFTPLAPLHQPHNLAGIRAVAAHRPTLPQVACFDTAFHQAQPALARRFALPAALHDEGIKRYGFHGLSYEHVAAKLPEVLGARAEGRVVALHLGNGASLCAMHKRRSVASTMGFTAVEGMMMGTRCGSLDPGVVLYLVQQRGMAPAAVEKLLYKESGLIGVSGISADMRALLASSDPRATLAVDLYVYRAIREVGSLAAALAGCEALVFTGGIGEHAATIRERIVDGCRWLHPELAVAVVPADEEGVIARHTLGLARERVAA